MKQPKGLNFKVGDLVEYEGWWGMRRERATIRGIIRYIGTLEPGVIPGIGAMDAYADSYAYLILPTEVVIHPTGEALGDVTFGSILRGNKILKKVMP